MGNPEVEHVLLVFIKISITLSACYILQRLGLPGHQPSLCWWKQPQLSFENILPQHVPVIRWSKLWSAICFLTMVIIYPQHEDWLPSNSDMAHEDWLVDLRWPRSINRHECSVSTSNTSCLSYISFNFIVRHFHYSLHWVYFCPITIQEAVSIYEIQINQFM